MCFIQYNTPRVRANERDCLLSPSSSLSFSLFACARAQKRERSRRVSSQLLSRFLFFVFVFCEKKKAPHPQPLSRIPALDVTSSNERDVPRVRYKWFPRNFNISPAADAIFEISAKSCSLIDVLVNITSRFPSKS